MKELFLSVLAILSFFDSFTQQRHILVPYRMGSKWGYSDTLGRISIQPKYDTATLFDYNRTGKEVIAEVVLKGKPMIINDKGKMIVPPNYESVRCIKQLEDLSFYVFRENKVGVFTKGKEIIPPVYDYMNVEWGVQYKVGKANKEGLIDSKGKIAIPVVYDNLSEGNSRQPGFRQWIGYNWNSATQDSFLVKTEEGYGSVYGLPPTEKMGIVGFGAQLYKLIDSAKRKFNLDSVQMVNEITGIAYKKGRKGLFLPEVPGNIHFFSRDYSIHRIKYFPLYERDVLNKNSVVYIIASLNGKYGIINDKEEEVLPFVYDEIEDRFDYYLLKQNNKIGFFIERTVYPIIQPSYDECLWKGFIPINSRWYFTLFKVIKNGKIGFVGENGVAYFKD
jgi:hypothetical protein